jgi:hypothetical protein
MQPFRLRDRADLIALIERQAPSPACKRACLTGKVEVLGGFEEIPPSTCPGWIVRITTKRGSVFQVAVIPDDVKHTYRVRFIGEVPWHLWTGLAHFPGVKDYSIYVGDHPADYTFKRMVALQELQTV